MKMKSGDTFTLDVQSLDELAAFGKTSVADLTTKINVGDTFSIAKTELCGGEVIQVEQAEEQDALERRANELLGVGAGSVGTPGTNSEDEDDSW
jgi:hypothetical protein